MNKGVYIFLPLVLILSGCSSEDILPRNKQTKNEIVNETTYGSGEGTFDIKGRKIFADRYYVTRYDPEKKIYCGLDPSIHKLDTDTDVMKEYQTVEAAQFQFPEHRLNKPCTDFLKD